MARPDNPAVVYAEASALIAAIKGESGSEPMQRLLEDVERGKVGLVTSAASLVEVRGGGRSGPVDPLVDKRIRDFLEGPSVVLVELDRVVGGKARELAHQYGLKTWDAVHLASAIAGGAEVMMTLDTDFPLDTLTEGVWIARPYRLGDPDLFDQG